jgi:hypothetical protein
MEYNIPTSLPCSGIALCELHLREREIHLAERERSLLELERRWRGGEQWPQTRVQGKFLTYTYKYMSQQFCLGT